MPHSKQGLLLENHVVIFKLIDYIIQRYSTTSFSFLQVLFWFYVNIFAPGLDVVVTHIGYGGRDTRTRGAEHVAGRRGHPNRSGVAMGSKVCAKKAPCPGGVRGEEVVDREWSLTLLRLVRGTAGRGDNEEGRGRGEGARCGTMGIPNWSGVIGEEGVY